MTDRVLQVEDPGANDIQLGSGITVIGRIRGINNRIHIAPSGGSAFIININGNNNVITVGRANRMVSLAVECGSHVPAHETQLKIGDACSTEAGTRILLHTSGGKCTIGNDCLISGGITFRCGESPHLIFEKDTGTYLDVSKGIEIGQHVWIGEKTYLTKNAAVPNDCIVAAASVVTRRFTETHSVVAGNPAAVVRKNIQWFRNSTFLEPGSIYEKSLSEFRSHFED